MMRRNVLAAIFLMPALFAQQPPGPAPNPDGSVTFRTNTQLVVETVSVKDRNGKVIEGLTAKDFTVTEDGVPQTIQFCEFQKLEEAAAAAAPQGLVKPAVKNQIS